MDVNVQNDFRLSEIKDLKLQDTLASNETSPNDLTKVIEENKAHDFRTQVSILVFSVLALTIFMIVLFVTKRRKYSMQQRQKLQSDSRDEMTDENDSFA